MGGSLFAIIFSGLIILTLLIIGQLFYDKHPKVSFRIWGFTVLLLFYFIYNFSTANSRHGDRAIYLYVGIYKIDISNSTYDNIDLSLYNTLQLVVRADKTFEFSYKTPFFTNTRGHCQPMFDGDISWAEISVGDKNLRQAGVEPDKWIFSGQELANRNNKNSIVFVKQ
jgi:hypothetical protein